MSDNGYINYIRSGYSMTDTHGDSQRAALHKQEVEYIVNDIVNQKLEVMTNEIQNTIEEIINQKVKAICQGVFEGLQRDVNVIASVAVNSVGEIFKKEQLKTVISNEILRQINKNLDKHININL